jgi:hypothetical protein
VNELVGQSWHDPASWSRGALPGPTEVAFVASGAHTAFDGASSLFTVGGLVVASGASLTTDDGDAFDVPGEIKLAGARPLLTEPEGGATLYARGDFAGVADNLFCIGLDRSPASLHLVGDAWVAYFTGNETCVLEIGPHRLFVSGPFVGQTNIPALPEVFTLEMTDPAGRIEVGVDGYFSLLNAGGTLTAGEITVQGGSYANSSWTGTGPTGTHLVRMTGAGAQRVEQLTFASLDVGSGPGPVTILVQDPLSGTFTSSRPTDMESGLSLSADRVVLGPGFSTMTGGVCYRTSCDDSTVPGQCVRCP